jgi:hypothetical protein
MAQLVLHNDFAPRLVQPSLRVQVADVVAEAGYDADGRATPATWADEYRDIRLVPLGVRWASNGDVSTLAFRRELGAADGEQAEPVELQAMLHGARVRLVDEETGVEWFAGHLAMAAQHLQAQPDAERYVLTAYGPELRLGQQVVRGQWCAAAAVDESTVNGTAAAADRKRANVVQTDRPCTFNPGGRGNCGLAAFEAWSLSTDGPADGAAVFTAPGRHVYAGATTRVRAYKWTAILALRSLVEWFDDYDTISREATNWDEIAATLGGVVLGEVRVDGLDLLSAVKAVLASVGYGFALEPWGDRPRSFKHRLLVYNLKDPASRKRPYLPPSGSSVTDADGRKAEVQRVHFVRDNHNVRNDVTVLGQPRRTQVALVFDGTGAQDLWPCWDTAAHDLDAYDTEDVIDLTALSAAKVQTLQERFHPAGRDFHRYRHVWRSFCWNEDGSFSQYARSGGAPALGDLAGTLGPSATRGLFPRPLRPAVDYDDPDLDAKALPVQVWLTVGADKVEIGRFCEIWEDYCGLTITRPLFEIDSGTGEIDQGWRPFEKTDAAGAATRQVSFLTLLHNTLRGAGTTMTITVYGTVEDDDCVRARSQKRASSSWPLISRRVVRDPGLRYQAVGAGVTGNADAVDDADQAAQLARRLRDAGEDEMGHASIIMPILTRAYPPGVGIPQTRGREMYLEVDGGDRLYCPVVRAVNFRFDETNTTELLLDSPVLEVAR